MSWKRGSEERVGKDWRQEVKGTTEDEMVGWHHWLDGQEFGWTPGVGDGQGSLACCDSWGRKEWTRMSNWTELNWTELKYGERGWLPPGGRLGELSMKLCNQLQAEYISKCFYLWGLAKTGNFLFQLPCPSANPSCCSEQSPFKPFQAHKWLSSFASNWQSIAEAECYPSSASLFWSTIWCTQTYAWLSVHILADHEVLLTVPCWWDFMVSDKISNK